MNEPKIDVLEVLNDITEIHRFLVEGNDKTAFFLMGVLTENLANRLRDKKD